ncbi:MAG: galactosyldiacylglycerol synthase [Proteobacteria bacterium]|nr:galactosyldiacylglycerol synthase [Pseudomonadota bacterium]
MRERTIDLVYLNAGGGHRASARAVEAVVARQGRPWRVRLLDLCAMLDPQQRFRRITGFDPEDLYNRRLARGWTFGMAQELRMLQALIRVGHAPLVRRLQRHWDATPPDLVLSLVPNFNRALCTALMAGQPRAPFAVLMTDMADHPPTFWIDPELPAHWICGTPTAVEQALAMGCALDRVHATSGMVIHPDFYGPTPADRAARLQALGLDPARPTGMVLFGGQGAATMLRIARALPDVQLILACGHNRALAERLRALPARAPRHVLGYTNQLAATMRLADFLIGKPGPGSLSEAVQSGLPVIVTRNAWTLPQERYNTRWVEERGAGLVIDGFERIRPAVGSLIAELPAWQARVRRIANRALFEVPEVLDGLLVADASNRHLSAAARSLATATMTAHAA